MMNMKTAGLPGLISLSRIVIILVGLVGCFTTIALAASTANIPALPWEERSDWINVKTAVQPGAKGDGIQDDTAAIQAALNKIQDGATIYFPPGTYRITKTLESPEGRYLGVTLLGHGRTTTLAWDGEVGGRMFWTHDGMPNTRYVGLTWDGRGKAAVGFDHACVKIFETEIRHQYEAYLNFTDSGIRVGYKQNVASAETLYDNCLFVNCKHGVSICTFNDLDHTFAGCEFRHCGVGIYSGKGSNFYARECHFEQSTEADISVFYCESGSSVRRCTSQGSERFLTFVSWVAPLTIQDCRVDGWKNPAGAVVVNGPPVLMFDCVFTHPPTKDAPVWVAVYPPTQKLDVFNASDGQRLILSNNKAEGSTELVKLAGNAKVYDIPQGEQGGVLTSAAQSFLKSQVQIPTKVFDAKRDFGAKGDGATDDTAAVQKAIDAARLYGKGAIAYLPAGRYAVSDTIKLTGSDYYFGGGGFRSGLVWRGKAGGTTIEISDPDRITLENIVVGHHDFGVGDNAIDILQTGTGKPSSMCYDRVWVFGMYQNKPQDRGLRLVNLGKNDQVLFRETNGNLRFSDSAQATILLNTTYEGTILLDGKSSKRDGFIGGMVRLATVTDPGLWVKDNQSIVMSDFYTESSQHFIRLEGDEQLPAGHVTIQGAKFELTNPANNGVEVTNYRGELALGPYQYYVGNPLHHFIQQGAAPFAVTLWASTFYDAQPDFKLSPAGKQAVLGCFGVGTEQAKAYEIADVAEKEALPRLTRALGDLRRLGAVDLKLNYAEKK